MFNEYTLKQKEKAYNYSKERFEKMNEFLTEKILLFKDENPTYSYIFITLARFINYKEDIWVKNKKTKNITTKFSKEILDDFIFNGKFTTNKIDFREERKKFIYNFDPVEINNILSGKENDSVWIIDNIRDSLMHGHFYIDFDNEKIIIENNHQDRILHCSISFELFLVLNELITEERIGGYTEKKLTTMPVLYREQNINDPILTTIEGEYELKYLLKNEFVALYCQVEDIFETDNDKKYKDLTDFYNFNVRLLDKMFKKFDRAKIEDNKNKGAKAHYTKTIEKYINDKMKNYNIKVYCDNLDDTTIEKIIKYIKEEPKFYQRDIQEQGLILHEILKIVLSHEKMTIERGVMDFFELYSEYGLKEYVNNKDTKNELSDLIFSNLNTFRENKKLANLFILGINNFVCNKEVIYDKYFEDYNQFDLNNFEYQDYSAYNKLLGKLNILNMDITNADNTLTKANNSLTKAKNNLQYAPANKHNIIQNKINELTEAINELAIKKNNLLLDKNNIINLINTHQTDSNGNYINNNNKSFFNHLRNAFAHNNISYLDDRITYNRKILLEDYDEDNNLTWRCVCRYYDLVKLLNNNLFLEAITNSYEKEKIAVKKI